MNQIMFLYLLILHSSTKNCTFYLKKSSLHENVPTFYNNLISNGEADFSLPMLLAYTKQFQF